MTSDPDLVVRTALREVLQQLSDHLGLDCSMVTRRQDDSWVVLDSVDGLGLVPPGLSLPWELTLCARTTAGDAPAIAADIATVPVLRDAAAALGLPISAYVSMPLRGVDGTVLGTLCGGATSALDPAVLEREPLLRALSAACAGLLETSLALTSVSARADRAESASVTDALTGVGNRRGWEQQLALHQRRCDSLAASAGIVVVDLDGLKELNDARGHDAGDRLLRSAAVALIGAAGRDDVLVRLGGDEFALLLVDADTGDTRAAVTRCRDSLASAGVAASVGCAVRRPGQDLHDVWKYADRAMYADKARSRAVPTSASPRGRGVDVDVDLDVDGEIDRLLAQVRHQLDLPVAFVSQLLDDEQVFRYVAAPDGVPIDVGLRHPRAASLCQRILDGRLPATIPDVRTEPAAAHVDVVEAGLVRAYIAVPVRLPDGSLYGTLCALSDRPAPELGARDATVLRVVAESIGSLLDGDRCPERRRARALERIRTARDDGAIWPAYQAVFDLTTGEIVGYEALARFGDGRPPMAWFTEAAQAGAGVELELLALELGLSALSQEWSADRFVAVNLSASTLRDPRTAAALAPLQGSGLLRRVVLELTEHEAVEDYDGLRTVLAPWRALGLRVAVDDAGAGHASLGHVLEMMPDLIKLDRSLVSGIGDDPHRGAMARSLVDYANRTGCLLVAEGVETEAEKVCLQGLGAHLAQGYLLGRPHRRDLDGGQLDGTDGSAPSTPTGVPLPRTPADTGQVADGSTLHPRDSPV